MEATVCLFSMAISNFCCIALYSFFSTTLPNQQNLITSFDTVLVLALTSAVDISVRKDLCQKTLQELRMLSSVTLKNITGYQRDLLKMRADHATSLLPNPIVVWTNESTRNMSWVDYLILCLLVIRYNNVTVQGGCVISSHIVDKRLCSY